MKAPGQEINFGQKSSRASCLNKNKESLFET